MSSIKVKNHISSSKHRKRLKSLTALETAQMLEDADKVLAFIQFSLNNNDYLEMNTEAQAGCDIVLEQVRHTVCQAAQQRN